MSILEQHDVAAYLLARRLISPRSIVAGRLRIEDASSRNRNYRVRGGPGESYLLKQGLAADSARTLANEAALYRRLSPGAAWVPRLHRYDRRRGLLILDWLEDGEDLARLDAVPAPLAAALGGVLAQLHAIEPDEEELRRDAPWVLALHRPPLEALSYLSAASIDLVLAIQSDEPLCRALDALREGWQARALVHRDVKRANCIAHRGQIALVDWEMAGWGDPAVDIGSALAECGPAAPALWDAYGGDADLLERSIRFAGARLVQTAYERTQEERAMSAAAAAELRDGRALLVDPGEAGPRLLEVVAG